MNIQNVSTVPSHIDEFLKGNNEKLTEIYDEGIKVHTEGLLYFQCSKEKNNVDVMFLFREKVIDMISEESWKMLKRDAGDKKIFLIKEGLNMFILKI